MVISLFPILQPAVSTASAMRILLALASFTLAAAYFCGRDGPICSCRKDHFGTVAECPMSGPGVTYPNFSRTMRKFIILRIVMDGGSLGDWATSLSQGVVRRQLFGFRSVVFIGPGSCKISLLIRFSGCEEPPVSTLASAHVSILFCLLIFFSKIALVSDCMMF